MSGGDCLVELRIGHAEVEDTFAEAFKVYVSRVLITAVNDKWALTAAEEATGFGTSLIMCPAEAGIDSILSPANTPDGRPGVVIQICHPSRETLEKQLLARIGQCVLTSPTAAAFNALDSEETVDTGVKLRFFGDGFESKGEVAGREVYRIPLMSGEFVVESKFGIKEGVAGGNLFLMGDTQESSLKAAEAAVDAVGGVEGAFTPFPGGIVASGSKVGSLKYKFMKASTNHLYCPALVDRVDGSKVPKGVRSIYEIVINGVDLDIVKKAMRIGIKAAAGVLGILRISAGNYGGKLGPYKIYLRELVGKED
jgi:formylmethanofuran--tetrahydromethanopterin N-formyltransferase